MFQVAAGALRVALSITSQRETKESQQPILYRQCLKDTLSWLRQEDTLRMQDKYARDDRIHGSLLALNEILRVSNIEWERQVRSIHHILQYQTQTLKRKERRTSIIKRLRGW